MRDLVYQEVKISPFSRNDSDCEFFKRLIGTLISTSSLTAVALISFLNLSGDQPGNPVGEGAPILFSKFFGFLFEFRAYSDIQQLGFGHLGNSTLLTTASSAHFSLTCSTILLN